MTDNEKDEEVAPDEVASEEVAPEEVAPARGADWEVVSLTASTYAAAPGPAGVDTDDERKNGQESSNALFMSEHFVFPPIEHENLPIEPDQSDILSDHEGQEEDIGSEDPQENKQIKLDDDPQETQFFDSGSTVSVHVMEFEEGKGLQSVNVEQGMDIAPVFSSFHAETGISESKPYTESSHVVESDRGSDKDLDYQPTYSKSNEEDKVDGSDIPSEAWWKRHAARLYHHAKEANTFWSIVVAAALTGIVILGKKWQRDKWHLQNVKWHGGINDEKMNRMLGPIGRLKDFIIGSHQRSPVIRGTASASH